MPYTPNLDGPWLAAERWVFFPLRLGGFPPIRRRLMGIEWRISPGSASISAERVKTRRAVEGGYLAGYLPFSF